ncbi:transketolase [Aestuariivirga litoralis]|uniref:transketolase n=1 Tax=Aestuariivirga litoralis TaxID=2650924 RepID=UPI0018C524B2|nr:transketolase [Aestuariivirga litoralis]MBG1232457.1 transketolase [Aestuariivirga litoralis]
MSDAAVVSPRQMANAIRALSMDAVQKANNGHPGLPMGAADVATALFKDVLKFDASAPHWPDRDRFILSAGHGSMLLYSLLHLTGYADMTIEQIKNFREWGSITAGHPEYGHATGIETTTGPLGQGIANAVGFALAERHLNARFGDDLVNHKTYVLAGDGCLMEGISQEALALAGHLKLKNLIVMWDDNGITIDGKVGLSDNTDQLQRFAASGWNVSRVDGMDQAAVLGALQAAQNADKPTMIACKTIIGFGATNKQGTKGVHGSPLGADEIAVARKVLDWDAPPFVIPAEIMKPWREAGSRGKSAREAWEKRLAASPMKAEFNRVMSGKLPENFNETIATYKKALAANPPAAATRNSSQDALNIINPVVVEAIGGSADLTGSNNTNSKDMKILDSANYGERYIHFGIREHGMAAAINGMALHGGVIPYGGTFFCFTDYCRPSIRLAALMGIRSIFVMTHDSIGLGADGPTHQPVEHLASLRVMPNLLVLRPCDAVETAECWQIALESEKTPSILVLTRQKVAASRLGYAAKNLSAQGAYEIAPSAKKAKAVIFAAGSEVEIAIEAKAQLDKKGIPTRVVSVPSMELFEKQSKATKAKVLGEEKIRIAIEAGVKTGWEKFIGDKGHFIGMTTFGASAPAEILYEKFGITAKAVVKAATAK